MLEENKEQDHYIGLQPMKDYYLTEKVGEGKIGRVYKAVRENPHDVLACKVIREGKLKQGWERELQKVLLLRNVPNVVQYHMHGSGLDKNSRPYCWVLWDYIPDIDLRKYLDNFPWSLDTSFVENIAKTVFEVLYACQIVGIQHGDLHEGNILISEPDRRLPGSPKRIFISDFGYGGSHNEIEPKDDYRQIFSIISNILKKIDPSSLNPSDRIIHNKMSEFLRKKLLEFDPTQGRYVGKFELLLKDLTNLRPEAEREAATAIKGEETKEPGDYLWAEALGYRADEWKHLFVPEFLAAQDLLSRNITVLTGARGCGKTMAFRRLTSYMDNIIGEPSGVKGSENFIGFYLNCRDLVEAFPWIPKRLNKGMQQQIMHYFHLAWFAEICKTLELYEPDRSGTFEWLDGFFAGTFMGKYQSLPQGADVLAHACAFLENEKERCHLTDLGSISGINNWPLARMDILDNFQTQIETHVSLFGEKPIYLFLDDYTIPIIIRNVQSLLNPIIFKRRSKLFFKVSTESANSFERQGLHGKPLELHQDFELIDLATESLHQNSKDKKNFIEKIFIPRIDRHPLFKGKNLCLKDILGKKSLSNNELAKQMRAVYKEDVSKQVIYHGVDDFVGMWASDIRTMIQMFVDMLRDANGELQKGVFVIPKNIQNKVYRSAGGEFLVFTGSVKNPSFWEKGPSSTIPGEPYGTHLRNIVEAYINVSRYELTKGDLVSNQGQKNPKQSFRLEIIDKFVLPNDVTDFYDGLIRWHLFLQDWRGKSVRGMITPRLFLNRVLIPFANLTFSSHDNIQLTNNEFISLLKEPIEFFNLWQKKRKNQKKEKKKRLTDQGPTLWD